MEKVGWSENLLAWVIPLIIAVAVLFVLFWIAAEKARRIMGVRAAYAAVPLHSKWLVTGYSTLTGENPVARIEADLAAMIDEGHLSVFSMNNHGFERAWRKLAADRAGFLLTNCLSGIGGTPCARPLGTALRWNAY
ncbi:hypothetical protein [Pyruvatibacter mobilis]|uniref:hypothetical protein n=1 Tax=Pyruvatibacter mobilis TaxID=1712261 RepID=UPI003BAF1E30